MKSTRRGFLSLIGGGAVAGPGALKGAIAKASTFDAVGASMAMAVPSECTSVGFSGYGGDWRAREILQMLSFKNAPSRVPNQYQEWYADIQALKSVSMVNKCRMQHERNTEAQIAGALREFVKEHRLNWIGLSETEILKILKKAAGE